MLFVLMKTITEQIKAWEMFRPHGYSSSGVHIINTRNLKRLITIRETLARRLTGLARLTDALPLHKSNDSWLG